MLSFRERRKKGFSIITAFLGIYQGHVIVNVINMAIVNNNLITYYAKRAKEYESVYNRKIPKRLKEQKFIGKYVKQAFKNRYVLELACGTGYWTKYLINSADKILATDINYEMLAIAADKIKSSSVQFLVGDAYNPPVGAPKFTGGMANFWFSHISKKNIKKFLNSFHTRFSKGSIIIFVDDVYNKDLGGNLVRKENMKDTFKQRKLRNEKFEILKNYYSQKELQEIFSPYDKKMQIRYLTYFWLVEYIVS